MTTQKNLTHQKDGDRSIHTFLCVDPRYDIAEVNKTVFYNSHPVGHYVGLGW